MEIKIQLLKFFKKSSLGINSRLDERIGELEEHTEEVKKNATQRNDEIKTMKDKYKISPKKIN